MLLQCCVTPVCLGLLEVNLQAYSQKQALTCAVADW